MELPNLPPTSVLFHEHVHERRERVVLYFYLHGTKSSSIANDSVGHSCSNSVRANFGTEIHLVHGVTDDVHHNTVIDGWFHSKSTRPPQLVTHAPHHQGWR